jgi:predicted transcriptional regulator
MNRPREVAPPLGEQERAVLLFIAAHAPCPARDVVEKFAGEQELARTTILTKIERLRRKGYLTRRRQGGVYTYSPSVPRAELLRGLVSDFVERTLDGSVAPLVSYLLDTRPLNPDDARVLERLVAELRAREQEEGRR